MHKLSQSSQKTQKHAKFDVFICDVVCHVTGALTLYMWYINRLVLLSVTINNKLVMHKFIKKFKKNPKTRKIWRFLTCDVICHVTGAITLYMWYINRLVLLSVTINNKLVMHKLIKKFKRNPKTRKIWHFLTCDVVCHVTGAITLCMWYINRRVLMSATRIRCNQAPNILKL
jgi:hypothetical protein